MAKNGRGAKQTHGDLTTAGVAGGGFGTLIVALANLMPNASTMQNYYYCYGANVNCWGIWGLVVYKNGLYKSVC